MMYIIYWVIDLMTICHYEYLMLNRTLSIKHALVMFEHCFLTIKYTGLILVKHRSLRVLLF